MTTINLAVEGEIATLTLNNPDKLNAINLAMWQQISANMASISADSGIRCVVLRGAGDQAFAAGGDLEEFVTGRATLDSASLYGNEDGAPYWQVVAWNGEDDPPLHVRVDARSGAILPET